MMTITKLEPFGARIKVYVDEEPLFVLYKGEICRFHIEEGNLDESVYNEIVELLYKRAKERSLYILESSLKTTKQIEDKLKAGFYPKEVIERVISFLKEYHFIDDYQYALSYIEYKGKSKSRKQILQDLFVKGISRELVETALEESGFAEEDTLYTIALKRKNRYDLSDRKELQKFYQYLLGKGYSYGKVREVISRLIDIDIME